jgi:hypothetical protein
MFGVSFEVCGVYAGTSFRDKMVVVAADETSNLGISSVLFQYTRRKVLDHSSCRR